MYITIIFLPCDYPVNILKIACSPLFLSSFTNTSHCVFYFSCILVSGSIIIWIVPSEVKPVLCLSCSPEHERGGQFVVWPASCASLLENMLLIKPKVASISQQPHHIGPSGNLFSLKYLRIFLKCCLWPSVIWYL